ncbi:hypothetical protein FEM48_ZijujUnG0055100 [Ziziphus jujuba var. spinosa]|uniref:non-specific serine/threonine protein kinase n=1 Tax=Ziziphus jujuba var. spinosa TaxID=714518 RepID=A0A978U989_ZIZJJ|nr:hypothetical protein FEM48_ZijujUnG0055100 [Ziziphus jujuba var. spinosa]
MKFREQVLLMMFAIVFFTIQTFVLSQSDSDAGCVLDIHSTLSGNDSDCVAGNWGGFVEDTCCGEVFYDYLYALAKWANQTQRLFLNATEQNNCLLLIKGSEKDVFVCGIEKLTSGAGGCSDYTVNDVLNNLGNTLTNFDEDCNLSGSAGSTDEACSLCMKRWKEIVGSSSDNGRNSMKDEAKVCSFAVLVAITSRRTGYKNWIQALYQCLGYQDFVMAIFDLSFEELHIDRNSITFIGDYKGLSILAGGIAGITLILLALIWILCKKGIKERFSTAREITDVSDDSQPDETSCLKIPRKEVYSATDNLNASNFIGQGVAGKVYKGVLSNGQHVAVKHIIKDGYIDTFIREVRSLSNVRHQNLVALLGYCEDKEECFLVYELCHNGNLSEWLFGKDKFLPWIHRLQIAIDSAKGVCFLHSYPEGCIVHRDIKARLLADGRNIEEFADPKLSSEYSMEAFDLVFKLALSCTGLKQQRPSMEQVVQKLEKALNISTQFN